MHGKKTEKEIEYKRFTLYLTDAKRLRKRPQIKLSKKIRKLAENNWINKALDRKQGPHKNVQPIKKYIHLWVRGSCRNFWLSCFKMTASSTFETQMKTILWDDVMCSLKINELNQSSQAGVKFFQLNSC